jgi:predicted ATPase/signal transduction histidine kinase/tRNA A-37 threonylcarbamoyl transferase component Bud32
MAVPLTGYRTSRLLRSSGNSAVYEAVREADGQAVVAKVFDLEDDDSEARVEHEFELIEALDVEGVVKTLGLERVGEQLVLLLERVPGVDLGEYSQRRAIELEPFFSIAIQITEVLGRVHARRIIHRDVKPTNILIEPDSGRVSLADFGISVLLESERRRIYDRVVLEGTLPYVSPEQTGRTARAVDFRSDLYSLGVTFYELLTGRRPFEFGEPLELIHAHLARTPEPPHAIKPELPDGLSRLVMKLLEKAPEHRYQTAAGLAADLRSLRELVERGHDTRSFELGREDFARALQHPHQLYGRKAERHELVDELERVVRVGHGRVLLLAGPPGVGKSSLLADFEGPVAGYGGYLAHGKFDPTHERPFAAFVEAFAMLVERILTESETRLRHWQMRLDAALGGVGRVVCELVPSLELVLGEQPAVAELEPPEARNRLHLAIARFLSAFYDDQQPLVLALDDLHWADRSSLALLRALIEGGRQGPLLILASFRDGEDRSGQPLRELIDGLGEQQRLRIIRVAPLPEDAVETLLAETLAQTGPALRSLAQIVGRKTANNPLFIRQFLTQLHDQGLLRIDAHGWTWDEQEVEAATIPDDVLEIMAAKLAALPPGSRDLLARAACIGPRFEPGALEVVGETPQSKLAPALYELVEFGLLAAVGREFRFAHERLEQAARASLPAAERRRLHSRYGRHLLAAAGGRSSAELDERLFEIVDQLDAGAPEDPLELALDERLELARLNLRAGRRALDTAAFEPALRYLERGVDLVADLREAVATRGRQAAHHDLVIDLHFVHAQALALSARHDEARQAFAELLEWRLDQGRHGHVAARWIRLLVLDDQFEGAIEFGLAALARCGHPLPKHPSNWATGVSLVRAWLAMRGRTSAELRALPECTNEAAGAVMELVVALEPAAYIVDPKLFVLLNGLHVRLFLRHGIHPTCPQALAQLAMGVGPGLGKIDDAIRLCEQGVELAELPGRSAGASARARVETGNYLFVWHRGRPFAEALARFDDIYATTLEAGDFEYAGYVGALGLSMHLEVGTHLRVVERLSRRFDDDLGRWGSPEMVLAAWMIRGLVVALAGRDPEHEGDDDLADALDPAAVRARGATRISNYVAFANRATVRLLTGEVEGALADSLEIIDDAEQVMFGSWAVARVALITVVAVALSLERRSSVAPRAHAALRKAAKILRRWARHSPDNYAHYLDLAEGLRAEMRSDPDRAMRLLERARVHAKQRGCRWVEGLAAERLAAVAEREGLAAFAIGALERAWEAYAAWGAVATLERLREEFPERFDRVGGPARADKSSSRRRVFAGRMRGLERAHEWIDPSASSLSLRSSVSSAEFLDFASVLQSVRVMTEDLRLDEVGGRVLEAAVTNAGADRGVLLLERDDVLGVVAELGVDSERRNGDGERRTFDAPLPLHEAGELCPIALVNFVLRTEQALVIDDARVDPRFAGDEYIARTGVQSLLGIPISRGRRRLGALVLENRLSSHCFTPERLEALGLIAGQAATALDNARLYTALRHSEARWRSLVDGAPDVIALLNEHGEVEFVNRNDLLKQPAPDARAPAGRLLELFASSSSADDWRAAVAAVLRDGVQRELEIELAPDIGPPRWYIARLAPIEAEFDGQARHAVVVATDITERKRAEADKHSLEAQLRQQQRLESVGTLASGVAHEINNPVQGILNYAELIADNAEDPGTVREFAGEITNESNRVATIVRNLLAFSRQEREQRMEDADVGELVRSTLSLVRAVMRKDHIQLEIAIPSGLPPVRCRVQQIQQIVMNLVTNARDALNERYAGYDEAKLIEIRAEPRAADGRSWVRLIVEDHGAGIPADVLPRIFDPFFTTKGRDQGTGLGLAVSHGIAKEHGGELSVDTTLGEGTRFRLDLPAV